MRNCRHENQVSTKSGKILRAVPARKSCVGVRRSLRHQGKILAIVTKAWSAAPLLVVMLGCSVSLPNIAAQGGVYGHKLNTTVDSKIARYYLENYLTDRKTDPHIDKQIAAVLQNTEAMPLGREKLKYLADQTSVDFAALYLTKSLFEDAQNRRAQSVYEEALSTANREQALPNLPPESSSCLILFVPGLFYKSEKETGADLANPRRVVAQMGLDNHFIEIEQSGTVEHNANLIEQAILRHSSSGKRLILVSASKAGPEVALALSLLERSQQPHQVKAWINIGGILQGSALADSAMEWPKRALVYFVFWWKGWDFASIESITTQKSQTRFRELRLPKQLLTINYIGIPLSGNISHRARDGYLDLRQYGPNDGLTLITDEIAPHSLTIVEPGLDHFLLAPDIHLRTGALAYTVIHLLQGDGR